MGSSGADLAVDFVEYWVRDLDSIQDVLTTTFGFAVVPAYVDVRTVDDGPDEVCCLSCGGVELVLRRGRPGGHVAHHVAEHGDSVGDLALVCSDPPLVAERALAAGSTVSGPRETPSVQLLGAGAMRHTLRAARLAPVRPRTADPWAMRAVDHVAYCVPFGSAEPLAGTYQDVFGLRRLDVGDCEEITTPDGGMRSVVLRAAGGFSVVLTEPLHPIGAGQTQRFLDEHRGPGLQHAAIAYDDIFAAVEVLQSRGVGQLTIPPSYYAQAQQRLPGQRLPWEEMRRLGILVDAEDDGLLFQLFTRPVSSEGAFFFELIQRCGATGFGANNVRALFQALESSLAQHGSD